MVIPIKSASTSFLISLLALAISVLVAFGFWQSSSVIVNRLESVESSYKKADSIGDSAYGLAKSPSELATPPASPPSRIASFSPRILIPNFELGDPEDALEAEAFEVVESLSAMLPNDPKAIHVSAVCNSQLNKTAEAQRLWLRCIELSPKTETYYLNVAANALFRGDTEIALQVLDKAESNGLHSADISHHLGMALGRLGEDERAVTVLEPWVAKDPSLAGHWMLLGQSRGRLGQHKEAFADLSRAFELGIKNRSLYTSLLNTAMRLGDKESAKKFQAILNEKKHDTASDGQQRYRAASEREAKRTLITVLAEASVVYRDAKKPLEAEQCALRLLAHDNSNFGILVFLTELYGTMRSPAEEWAVRKRMLELNPSDISNRLRIARLHAENGAGSDCEAMLKSIQVIQDQRAIGFAAMAEYLVSQNEHARAQWHAEQALKRERSAAGFRLLTSILRAQGKESEAQSVEQQISNSNRSQSNTAPSVTAPAGSASTSTPHADR